MASNPYALYINCDGAMDYSSKNPGGIGYVIRFPDSVGLEDIHESIGTYLGANIERLELEALIQALSHVTRLYTTFRDELRNTKHIVFVTDRFGLCDSEKTSPYQIRNWRQNNWHNHEGKPIKNHELLDKLDKARKKLADAAFARIEIQYKPRKQNKEADKLAKAAKKDNPAIRTLVKVSEKIGKRLFEGAEMSYSGFSSKQTFHINIFRKDPVQNDWEVWAEICDGDFLGRKFKLYADDILAGKLQRGNQYKVRLKDVFRFHVTIYRSFKKVKKAHHL